MSASPPGSRLKGDIVCGIRVPAKNLFQFKSRVTDVSEALFGIPLEASLN